MIIFYHVKSVEKNSIHLAEKYDADVEAATIAACLHNISAITDYKMYEEHHIYGAEIAENI